MQNCPGHLERNARAQRDLLCGRRCEANYWFEFSAARKTMSPHLSAEENRGCLGRQLLRTGTIIAPAYVSSGKTRSGTAAGPHDEIDPVFAHCEPNSITGISTKFSD